MNVRMDRIASARRIFAVLGAVLSLAAAGCPKPPPPPPRHPEVLDEPPPKCEALSERCKAKSHTSARLPGISYAIAPPLDWIYAQESLETVIEKVAGSEKQAVFAIATFDQPKQGWEVKKLQLEVLGKLSKKLGVTLSNPNVIDFNMRKTTEKVGDVEMTFHEQPEAKRGGKEGYALVVTAAVDKMQLVALAFAPDGDNDASAAEYESIKSLKKGSSK